MKEAILQDFFETYPHFLKGLDYKSVLPHPVLERQNDGALIPDFMLEPIHSSYVDLLDLKLPNKNIVVGRKDRKRVSQSVQDSIVQLREYQDYFENPAYREYFNNKYGVSAYRPKGVIVIGRRVVDVPDLKYRQILSDIPRNIQLLTYDDLLDKMKFKAEQYKY